MAPSYLGQASLSVSVPVSSGALLGEVSGEPPSARGSCSGRRCVSPSLHEGPAPVASPQGLPRDADGVKQA